MNEHKQSPCRQYKTYSNKELHISTDTFKNIRLTDSLIINFELLPIYIQSILPKFIIDDYDIEADLTKQIIEIKSRIIIFFLKLQNKQNNNEKYFLKISNAPYYKAKKQIYIPEIEIYELINKDKPDNILIPIYFNVIENFLISLSNYYEYDLFEYLTLHTHINEYDAKHIYFQLCVAIKYFHNKNIMIGDLKLENILINSNTLQIYLIDLETCYQLTDGNTNICYKNHNGTLDYFAPESFIHGFFGLESDVWASGIILFNLLYGFPPTNKQHFYHAYKKNNNDYKTLQFVQKKGITKKCYDLLSQILNCDIDLRININDIITHEWFSK
jgi:serine/threonine protein kinase